jgi:hypothetical protein
MRLHFKPAANSVYYEFRAKSVNTHQAQRLKFPNVTTLRFILKNSRTVMPDEFCYRFIQDWGRVVSKVKFTQEQARVEVYPYSFFNLGARWGWVVNAMPWPVCI